MATAVLSARHAAGAGLVLVSLDVDDALARAYVTPGQYVEVKAETGNGYFVLAGDVGVSPWELLVRNAGDAAETLVTAPIGTAVEISSPLGDGFPTAQATRPLVVAVVGSALAVARPVVRRRIAEGVAHRTLLLLGVKTRRDVPLVHEVRAWADAGVRVLLCLSQRRAPGHGAGHGTDALADVAHEHGYVQHVLDRILSDPKGRASMHMNGALVVSAGPEAMLADMRALGEAHRVAVVTNV